MKQTFKIITALTLSIPCQGMDLGSWFSSSDKKAHPKKYTLTLINESNKSPENLSQNIGFITPMTFKDIFGTVDTSIRYLGLYSEMKDQNKDYPEKSLRNIKGIISVKMGEEIQRNYMLLNEGMTKYIQQIEPTPLNPKNKIFDFVPLNSNDLESANYIHFDILITPHREKDPLNLYGKVLAHQLQKKFNQVALSSAMNKVNFNLTGEDLQGQYSIKDIVLSLSGYQGPPKQITFSSKIMFNILNESGIKIDTFKEPQGKTMGDLLITKEEKFNDCDFSKFDIKDFQNQSNRFFENVKPYDYLDPVSCNNEFEIESPQIKKLNLDFKTLGIGGLDKQMDEIKDALISRGIDEKFRKKADFEHTKGIILYGPPGTGKTLIARKMAEILGVEEKYFKVINGPEILNKFIGESEKNIRDLFELAEQNPHKLIVLFFDEIDAIASCRSSGNGAGDKVGNNIVNQLLSKMDGVDAIKNVLVIGATNRLDMIDPALIRPGRFDLKLYIELPDEKGRKDILDIHLKELMKNAMLKDDNPEKLIMELALKTQNFTGAELKGLCDIAKKLALQEVTNPEDLSQIDEKNYFVTKTHLLAALRKINPAFGQQTSSLEALLPPMQITLSSQEEILEKLLTRKNAFRFGQVSSLFISGSKNAGKSTIAALFAKETKDYFDLTRIITPNILRKSFVDELNQLWLDTQRVNKSLIVLDGLENLLSILNDYKYDEQAIRSLNNILASKTEKQVVLLVTMELDSLSLFQRISPITKWTYTQLIHNLNLLDLNEILASHGIKKEIIQDLSLLLNNFSLSLILDICNVKTAENYTLSDWEKRIRELC